MPLHVPVSRRQFLASTIASAAALSIPRLSPAADAPQSLNVALLADTHIAADREAVLRGVTMAHNLRRVWDEVCEAQPAAAMIHGDVAVLKGQAEDYRTMAELIIPPDRRGIQLHFLLGNHDDRGPFREVLRQAGASPLDSHHVALLEAGPVRWLMLDSLDKVNVTPGILGEAQLAWLSKTLDAHPDKPALISVHHNPVWPDATGAGHNGLRDTEALFAILQPRKQVKAVFFGHTHDWSVKQREGLHLVNLPPVAYVFAPGKPSGWVAGKMTDRGMTLKLHALDRGHAQNGETHELAWR